MAEFVEAKLKRQLNLYQSFLKIYEYHSTLLDEILQLENSSQSSLGIRNQLYVEGVISGSVVSLVTNLCEDKTQTLRQTQQVWTVGRDRTNGIRLDNPYISRRHAIIRFCEIEKCFYLMDLNSSNGCFINGERVYQSAKLQESDRIRLGSLTFSFFLNVTTKILPDVAADLLLQSHSQPSHNNSSPTKILHQQADDTIEMLRTIGLMGEESRAESLSKLLHIEQKPEIVDYFLRT
jgi:pSer/pThr/pTyr-binding forkhead associated (FHA) protein